MLCPGHVYFLVGVRLVSIAGNAEYEGDDIPGFLGLQPRTKAALRLYVGNKVWVYPTDTIKDSNTFALDAAPSCACRAINS